MIKKNLKYYSLELDPISIETIKNICVEYTNIKNYFYSRYSGINSYEIIFNHRKEIRDVLIKDKNINFKLPSRFWKLGLDECISNIKSNWSNTINKVKDSINKNESFSNDEKHYLRYYLKTKHDLFCILTNKEFVINDKFKDLDTKKLNKYLKRLIRKYKGNISYSKKKNGFSLDSDMYKQLGKTLYIQTPSKGNRLPIELNTTFVFNKTIQIRLLDDKSNKISISQCIDSKVYKNNNETNIVAIDKNYENVVASSNGNVYGSAINNVYNKYTDLITEKYKKRNKILSILKKHKEQGNQEKVNNIIKNNLGSLCINNKKRKLKEIFKSIINESLNDFIEQEKPTTIVVENLKFQVKNKKGKNKKSQHKMHHWCKGYVQERIYYKSKQNNINVTEVNAAFTSQQCPHCGFFFEERTDKGIVHCHHCGKGLDKHIASAMVILSRFNDEEINLKTPVLKIKELLLNRNKALLDNHLEAPPPNATGATLTLNPTG